MSAKKNSPTFGESGALPETRNRIRPPSRSRIFAKTRRSAIARFTREHRRGRSASQHEPRRLVADADRPVGQLPARPLELAEPLLDRSVELLPGARHARHHGRLHALQVARDARHRLREVDADAVVEAPEQDDALEDVAQREEREDPVGGVEADPPLGRHDVRHDVPVGQHDALGIARRAGRVDDRGQRVAWDRLRLGPIPVGRLGVGRQHALADRDDVGHRQNAERAAAPGVALDDDNRPQFVRALVDLPDLRHLGGVRDDGDARGRLVQDEPHLGRRERRVDGHRHGAGRRSPPGRR